MIFNKNENGAEELKHYASFLYSDIEYENIVLDVDLACEDLIKVIGEAIFKRALEYYQSDSFDINGKEINDLLVKHIQLPIALFAYKSYSENIDLSHESSGRKVKIDSDNEKLPWQWMLDRDDKAILKKAFKTTDRLIEFLDKNADELSEWKNSAQKKAMDSLIIKSAEEFDSYYPIEKSRRFFLIVLPFIKEIEEEYFESIFKDFAIAEIEPKLLKQIKSVLALLTIAKAVIRLSISALPDSVVHRFSTERQTADSSSAVLLEEATKFSKILTDDAIIILNKVKNKFYPEENEDKEYNSVDNKFFTV